MALLHAETTTMGGASGFFTARKQRYAAQHERVPRATTKTSFAHRCTAFELPAPTDSIQITF